MVKNVSGLCLISGFSLSWRGLRHTFAGSCVAIHLGISLVQHVEESLWWDRTMASGTSWKQSPGSWLFFYRPYRRVGIEECPEDDYGLAFKDYRYECTSLASRATGASPILASGLPRIVYSVRRNCWDSTLGFVCFYSLIFPSERSCP